jgi:hypothetical protein
MTPIPNPAPSPGHAGRGGQLPDITPDAPGDCPPRNSNPNVQHGPADKTTPPVPVAEQKSPALATSSCSHDDRGGAWPMRAHRPNSLDPIWEANR